MTITPRIRRLLPVSLLLAVVLPLANAGAAGLSPNANELPVPPADAEGLERTTSKKVDEFYLRPGASFTAYRRVLLNPVDVSFARLWARSHRDVDARETAKLRTELGKLASAEFSRQLERGNGGYPVVTVAGPDVLEVRASIVNLDIRAPDIQDSTVRHSYVLSAGEGTLIAELRDSQTGTLLARVVDRREMREYPEFMLANSVSNSADARELVGLWSKTLRRYLDTARAEGRADDKGS